MCVAWWYCLMHGAGTVFWVGMHGHATLLCGARALSWCPSVVHLGMPHALCSAVPHVPCAVPCPMCCICGVQVQCSMGFWLPLTTAECWSLQRMDSRT